MKQYACVSYLLLVCFDEVKRFILYCKQLETNPGSVDARIYDKSDCKRLYLFME